MLKLDSERCLGTRKSAISNPSRGASSNILFLITSFAVLAMLVIIHTIVVVGELVGREAHLVVQVCHNEINTHGQHGLRGSRGGSGTARCVGHLNQNLKRTVHSH
jgi:hypothetical protein